MNRLQNGAKLDLAFEGFGETIGNFFALVIYLLFRLKSSTFLLELSSADANKNTLEKIVSGKLCTLIF